MPLSPIGASRCARVSGALSIALGAGSLDFQGCPAAAASAKAVVRPRRKRLVMMKKCLPCTAKVMKVSTRPGLILAAFTTNRKYSAP